MPEPEVSRGKAVTPFLPLGRAIGMESRLQAAWTG